MKDVSALVVASILVALVSKKMCLDSSDPLADSMDQKGRIACDYRELCV